MNIGIPRLFGEIHDRDTQFTATIKQNQEMVMVGLFVAVIGIGFLIYSLLPDTRQGTWRYAICKIFLEQYTQYPTELKILTVAEKQNSAQIGYLTTNSYGSQESQLIECFYNINPQAVTISRITIDRKPLIFNLRNTMNDKPTSSSSVVDYKEIVSLLDIGRQNLSNTKYTQMDINEFNKTIGTIMVQGDLNLTIPPDLSQDINDLKTN